MAAVVAVLGSGLAALAPAVPAVAAPAAKLGKDLPGLKSDPAPKVSPQVLPGDFTNPPPHPSQLDTVVPPARPNGYDPDRSVTIDAETTPTKKVVANRDGSKTAIVSATPVRFKDASGWHDIDLALVPGAAGQLTAKAAPGAAKLAATADGVVASIDTPAGTIGLRHSQSSATTATTSSDKAIYKGALSGRDLVLAPTANGFEESVVLADARAGATYLDEYVLPAGVTARSVAAGVEFLDATGAVVATVSNGLAYDSARTPSGAPVTVRVVPNAAPAATTTTVAPSTTPSTTVAPATSTTTAGASSAAAPTTTTTAAPTTTTTAAPTTTAPAKAAENVATVEVAVDQRWLGDPSRVFPVTLDPTTATNSYNPYGVDTFALAAAPTTNYGASTELYIGNILGGGSESFIKFTYLNVPIAPTNYVTGAFLRLQGVAATDCSKGVDVFGIDGTLSDATVWNNRPAAVGDRVTTRSFLAGCGTGLFDLDTTTLTRSWITSGAPNNGLRVSATDPADPAGFKRFASGNTASPPTMYITYDQLPGLSAQVAPASGSVLGTATPTFHASVTSDLDGDPVKYWFRATPAPDAESGAKTVDSGWLLASDLACPGAPPPPAAPTEVCYTAPIGSLSDGVTYYWHVWTYDGTMWRPPEGSTWSFRVDLGLGDKGPQPRDTVGPVSVNLASGNATVQTASQSFPTARGTAGLSYAYNSQTALTTGLTGSYYPLSAGTDPPLPPAGAAPAMQRNDPTVDHYWGTDGPGYGLDPTAFMVRWTGTLNAPADTYIFTADHDNGIRVRINGNLVIDKWLSTATNPADQSAPQTISGPVPFEVDYYQSGGPAFATVAVIDSTGKARQIPPTWLAPDASLTSPVLSPGWTMTPAPVQYGAAVLGDRWVAFVDSSGGYHTYTWTGSAFEPGPADDGVVGMDTGGALTLSDGGIDYVFDRAGSLMSATSAIDDGVSGTNTSSLTYNWGAVPTNFPRNRLTSISDGPGNRQIILTYQAPTATGCPSAKDGFDGTAPDGALCKIHYWDGTDTLVYYSQHQLAQFADPGGAVTDFRYTGVAQTDRLASVGSALAADAQAAQVTNGVTGDALRTVLAYDAGPTAAVTPRVTSVTAPSPAPDAQSPPPRPAHSYTYDSDTQTSVAVAGLSPAPPFARRVTFSRNAAGGLTVGDTDADGVATTAVYDAGERPTSVTDGANRRTTTFYDGDATRSHPSGRATETFGPADASCFGSDNRPNGTCTDPPVAHTAATYDADPGTAAWTGLAAEYWQGTTLAGKPAFHTEAAPGAGGVIAADPPMAGLTAGAWSSRLTGEGSIDQTSTAANPHVFSLVLTGQARLFVDDRLVVDAWPDHATTATVTGTFANTTAGRHRIRVDYAPHAGAPASLTLRWRAPGGSDVDIPADKLAPRYSTSVRTVTDDTTAGVSTRVDDLSYSLVHDDLSNPSNYNTKASRLVGTATTNPGGAGLATVNDYESIGQGARRPITVTAAAGTASGYAYYGPSEGVLTDKAQCPGTATNQGRALKSVTNADMVRSFAYDSAGRVVGTREGTEDWTCTSYDSRGRVLSVHVPAYGGEPVHDFAYAYPSDPRVGTVTEGTTTITTKVDLLGRVVSYTDAWNKTTTSTYDQPGRLTATSGPAGAFSTTYSAGGRIVAQALDNVTVATAALASSYVNGELTGVTYPTAVNGGNGTSLTIARAERTPLVTSLSWSGPAGSLAADVVKHSQSGRMTDEMIDGTDANTTTTSANPAAQNYLYDGAGRLTEAWSTPTQHLTYSYGAVAGCSLNPTAGMNSNRSTTTLNGGTPTTYCYDQADRLVSSTDPGVGTVAYDSHGNTTTLGTQTLIYDGADRHMETKVNGATVVRYGRDATGRITSRTEGTTVTHYGFAGPGDSPAFTMDASNNVTERTIGLIGGAMVTKRGGLLGVGDVWSYPNVHGDVIATADNTGVKQGPTRTYDPYGQALTALPDNSAGNFDYGWLGSDQRPIEHAGSLATIEMGARQYVPSLGRFLEVDPVAGGSCNDYEYVCGDPLNQFDLTGTSGWWSTAIDFISGDYCHYLREQIKDRVKELDKRIRDAIVNKNEFQLNDQNDINHYDQFKAKQRNLVSLVQLYLKHCDCNVPDVASRGLRLSFPAPGGGPRPSAPPGRS